MPDTAVDVHAAEASTPSQAERSCDTVLPPLSPARWDWFPLDLEIVRAQFGGELPSGEALYREALRPDRPFDWGNGDVMEVDGLEEVVRGASSRPFVMGMAVDPNTGVVVPFNGRKHLLSREEFEELVTGARSFYDEVDEARLQRCSALVSAQTMSLELNQLPGGAVVEPVYVLRSECNLHKIGRSRDIRARLRSLRGASPQHLGLLYILPVWNAQKAEFYLHQRYWDFHRHHEWFALPEWALAELRALRDSLWASLPDGCEPEGRSLQETV